MKVYVVILGEAYEGGDVLGVAPSEGMAKRLADNRKPEIDPDEGWQEWVRRQTGTLVRWDSHRFEYQRIEGWEVSEWRR